MERITYTYGETSTYAVNARLFMLMRKCYIYMNIYFMELYKEIIYTI